MVDNFNVIPELLEFNSADEFYFVQLIQRKKDNPDTKGVNNNNRLIRAYYITSVGQLLDLKEEMTALANYFNARVGINLNKRSFEKTAFNTMKKIAEQMHNKDYKNVKAAYNTACGIHNAISDKRWILDIDRNFDVPLSTFFQDKRDMIKYLNNEVLPHGIKVLHEIESKDGWHLITTPFNTQDFVKKYPDIEIHKNNPTNLYIP